MDKAFSTNSLAKRWNCSGQHIRNMIKRGELSCFHLGNLVRISSWEVNRIEGLSSTGGLGTLSGETAGPNVTPFVRPIEDRQSETSKNI